MEGGEKVQTYPIRICDLDICLSSSKRIFLIKILKEGMDNDGANQKL